MLQLKHERKRRGAVLPILTICLVGLMAFVALAIDIGMMAVARSQAQNAADIAALAGARTLDGKNVNNNLSGATTMAQTAAINNQILNTPITAAQVTSIRAGIYRYDASAGKFQVIWDSMPGDNEAYGVFQVTINTQQPTFFARVLGVNSLNIGAMATAVHRPRDLALVLDFSGSMGYSSNFNYSNNGTRSLSPDSRFPRFGPWSIYDGVNMVMDLNNPGAAPSNLSTYVPPTPMQRVWAYQDGTGYLYAPNNLTMDTPAGPAIAPQFVQADNSTSAFVRNGAFPSYMNVNVNTAPNSTSVVTPAPDEFSNQNATNFVGDKFPLRSGVAVNGTTAPTASQYAHTVWRYLNASDSDPSATPNTTRSATFELNGYDWDFTDNKLKNPHNRFQGFTMGPGYFGKTFYMWPPDPRTPTGVIGDNNYVAGDWRRRFFLPRSGSGQDTSDNSMLWDSSGRWREQNTGSTANYIVNYDAILAWLTRGPQTLPPSLRSGRVVYYDSIPTSIPIDQSTGRCTSGATDDQRFWKDYIDYVIGAGRWTDSSNLFGVNGSNSNTGGGSTVYYNTTAGNLTPRITSRSNLLASATANAISGATNASPITVTSTANHGLTNGERVTISGVTGNTAANGTWTVTVVDSMQFTLDGSTGNGNYSANTNDNSKSSRTCSTATTRSIRGPSSGSGR